MSGTAVGPNSTNLVCTSCGATIQTRLKKRPSTRTHLIAILLCVCLCWPCAFIPYCMDTCKNIEHYCPNCDAYLGTYHN